MTNTASSPTPDATSTVKGKLRLTGDLGGTATSPTVTAITSGSASNLNSGTLPDARMPALTGDVTSSAGAVATTIAWTRNPYTFRAFGSVATTLVDNVSTQITFATEEYDHNNNFAANAYTAPYAGVYNFSAGFSLATSVSTPVFGCCEIRKNGNFAFRGTSQGSSFTAAGAAFAVSGDILLAAGDVITAWGFQDSAGNEATNTGSTETWFSGHLVHRTA